MTLAPIASAGFTVAGPVTSCNGATDPIDGFYLYTANLTGVATFSTCPFSTKAPGSSATYVVGGAVADTTLAAYDASACPITQAELACQDGAPDCPGALQAEISFSVVAGTSYYVSVGDWNNGTGGITGNLGFVVDAPPPPPPATLPPIGLTQTLPPGFEAANTGFISNQPFGTTYASQAVATTGMLHQYAFDTSLVSYKGKQRINRISFRQHPTANCPGGTTNLVDVYLTSSPNDSFALSATFANNRGTDYTLVYSGPITWPAGIPTGFGNWVPVTLTTAFDYDPTLGNDLLVEVQTKDPLTVNSSPIEVSFGPARTQANINSATGATGNTGLVTAALLQLDYTPLPFLKVTTAGGGAGDLTVTLTDLPAAVTKGYTLISTDTSHPFDSGPIIGIYPSQTMFDVLSFAPSFGNPLAWITGVPSGFYPTSPFSVAAPTLAFLAGQTWDFVTLAISDTVPVPGVNFYFARSNVVRVNF